jgi:radical SAM protein, TIGR01212 family
VSTEPIYPWGDSRRYNTYSGYFRRTFGGRVQKLTIDAGFTCPNRDGTVGTGGCTYCNNDAFNPSYCNSVKPILQQVEEGIEFHANRYRRAENFLAYFQAFSNTHAPLEKLKEIYAQALAHPKVVGLVIGTRPDCIDEAKLDYLAELAQHHYVIVEYGIESCHNQTLKRINRGHTYEQAEWAIRETAKRGIRTGAHLIFGLPGESREQMLSEAAIISQLPLDTVKFHQLQIVTDTTMEKDFLAHPEQFQLFELQEYLSFLANFLEKFNPNIVVERFVNEVPPWFLVAPNWGSYRADQLGVMFEKLLEARNTWQGKKFS